jgi:DNA repair exonuclease SbcCD nuclease subunit
MSNLNITYQIERNPIINIEYNNKITNKILCIGDPHLGRVFRTGVPAHRVGEREEGQYAALRRLLNPTDPLITHIVIMGDLFDKFVVSPTVVLKAVELLQEASNTNSNIEYYVIPGNHDMTKDTSKKSSYELFYEVFNGHIMITRNNIIFNIRVVLEASCNNSTALRTTVGLTTNLSNKSPIITM